MKGAKMSKQNKIRREFEREFQNASEFRGDFQSEIQNTCQNSRRKFIKTSAKMASLATLSVFTSINLNACKNDEKSGSKAYNPNQNNLNSNKGETMNLTNTARQNLERYFGADFARGELAQNDKEFFEAYANFAFDEVLAHTNLDEKERLMLTLGALIATQGASEYKNMLEAALNAGVLPVQVKEICYQATPYVGMGKALEFILATNEVFKKHQIALPLPAQSTTIRQNRVQKGLKTQRALFGEAIDKGNAAAPADEKHIRTFLSGHCFGDFYTREGLDLRFRELLTFVFVASLGGADAQVKAHIQGNFNIGNDRARLIATLTALVPYIGYPRVLNALGAIPKA